MRSYVKNYLSDAPGGGDRTRTNATTPTVLTRRPATSTMASRTTPDRLGVLAGRICGVERRLRRPFKDVFDATFDYYFLLLFKL